MQNSSVQDSILSKTKKLYIITGKGGVGKTTIAMALVSKLKNSGKKVLYNNVDQLVNHELCDSLQIPHFELDIKSSIQQYISKKLNSEIIAAWIMKTPFTKSLFNIIPSLGYMIFLGHIIHMLQNDEELIIVLDSQSSGHALTMLESPFNFQKIFNGGGLISNDVSSMIKFIQNKDLVKMLICNLPTPLAVSEGEELRKYIEELGIKDNKMVLNNSLNELPELKKAKLPPFLSKKISLEKKIIRSYKKYNIKPLPHVITQKHVEVIKEITPLISDLL